MKLGAVLPLCVRGSYDVDDLTRAEILFSSLTAFAEPDLFSQFLIVTPPDEVEIVEKRVEKWAHLNIQVMSEEALVPELKEHQHMRGWRKQQIVKIAAAREIKSDFFVTFDADVICLKPLSYEKLVIDGKALMQYEQREQHPKWWKSSARILGMNGKVGDPEKGMTVTPAILSTEICKRLAEQLAKSPKRSWVHELCSLHNPKNPKNWWIGRYLKNKWTEYSLYYLCAHKLGILDQYHITAGTEQNPQLMLVHESHPFENWDTDYSFSERCPGLFCVVGSKSGLEPNVVWDKIAGHIPPNELAWGLSCNQ